MLTFGVNYFWFTNQNLVILVLLESSGSLDLQDLDSIYSFNLKISSEVLISGIFW